MPAIQLARLKIQIARLGESFSQPAAFVSGLHNLLDFYADRTHRPGQSGKPSPLLTAYHVPPPILRQILLEITPRIEADPDSSLALLDELWKQPYLEFRLLAANLLGMVPVIPPEPVVNRLQEWVSSETEDKLIETLLNQSIARLRTENRNRFFDLIKGWLNSTDLREQQLGLRAILTMLNDPSYDNLPYLFRLLTPLTRTAPARLRPFIIEAYRILAQRAPTETAYFLRQSMDLPESPGVPWVARQILQDLPKENKDSLREALRSIDR